MISKSCVRHIINIHKNGFPSEAQSSKKLKRVRSQPARSAIFVAKVKAAVTKENPRTQRSIANRTNTSKGTVWHIIHENWGLERRHKARGHALKERHIKERFTIARKLYENYLAGDKWQWIVSLDEVLIYLDNTNRPRKIYYGQ